MNCRFFSWNCYALSESSVTDAHLRNGMHKNWFLPFASHCKAIQLKMCTTLQDSLKSFWKLNRMLILVGLWLVTRSDELSSGYANENFLWLLTCLVPKHLTNCAQRTLSLVDSLKLKHIRMLLSEVLNLEPLKVSLIGNFCISCK